MYVCFYLFNTQIKSRILGEESLWPDRGPPKNIPEIRLIPNL